MKPGVTWWELHNLAVDILREAGGYDQHKTYGIGRFVGMEVHDEGDYEQPLQPRMVLSIEQGVTPPDSPRVTFEDDVLVTETGHEWWRRWRLGRAASMVSSRSVTKMCTQFRRAVSDRIGALRRSA